MLSQAVIENCAKENPEAIDLQGFSLVLARLVRGWQNRQMVEVAGVEPASLVLSHKASTRLAFYLLSSRERESARSPVSRLSKVRPPVESRPGNYAC